MNDLLHSFVDGVVGVGHSALMPLMAVGFIFGVAMRGLVFFTVKREEWFSREFDRRIWQFMDADDGKKEYSFFLLTKRILEKTFYELFEIRGVLKRFKLDYVMAPSDRIFLIQAGSACLVRDTLKQVRHLRLGGQPPKFLEISKAVLQHNPCFNRVFGMFPAAPLNEFLGVLPGLFIVGGIFGTFLGIMKALPELGGMDLNDVEGTKVIMDGFLLKVAFSMATSCFGILLSVMMTFINTFMDPERVFIATVERYELSLEYLWRRSTNNDIPANIAAFDEHRDPLEALAEFSINKELSKWDPQAKERFKQLEPPVRKAS